MESELVVIEKPIHTKTGTSSGSQLPPHPNIAFRSSQGKVTTSDTDNSTEDYSTAYSLKEPLDTFLSQNGNLKISVTSLLQLTHAVHHLHENKWVHKEIKLQNIYVSKHKNMVVLCHPAKIYQISTQEEIKQDIRDLKNVFQSILTSNGAASKTDGYDSEIAEDLLKMMVMAKTTTTHILQHPFFWGEDKKLNFLSHMAQFSKSDRGIEVKKALNKGSSGVFDSDGWKIKLKITDLQEKGQYTNQLRKRKGVPSEGLSPHSLSKKKKKVSVGQDVIKKFTDEMNKSTGKPMYHKDNLQSLMNFIRNRREHFWESSVESQACFYYDHASGFWQFFSKRFPDLFTVVYNVVKKEQKAWNHPGIKDIYFDAIAQNKKLPML